MTPLKIALRTACYGLPLPKSLALASRAGAAAVEIDARNELKPAEMSSTAIRQIRKILDDRQLKVAAVAFPTRRGYDVEADLDRRVDATKAAMKMACELGASVVINQIGFTGGEEEDSQPGPLLMEVLSELGVFGQHVGCLLTAETGAESGASLRRVVNALPVGTLGVTYNPGNLIINGFSASEAIDDLGPHIHHVRAKDGTRDLAQGRGIAVPLGRGSVDWPNVFASLEDHAYRGWFALEASQPGAIDEIEQAMEFLRNL
jgi:sugar phosphate isomerase/epimerase